MGPPGSEASTGENWEVGNSHGVNGAGGEASNGREDEHQAETKSGIINPPRVADEIGHAASSSFPDGTTNTDAQGQQKHPHHHHHHQGVAMAGAAAAAMDVAAETGSKVASPGPDKSTVTGSPTGDSSSSGGGGAGSFDAEQHVIAGTRDKPPIENGGGASTAGGGGAHRQQSQNTAAQQDKQPPAAASARAMVPDKEDDDDDNTGGAASQRQYTLQNYASRDSGAVMLESSPTSKGMSNLLVDSKDKYAISPCEDKQWAVLGLSEDILVRTIRLSNHEKYSSLVKDFQVLASQTYPVNEWLDLGTFTAKFVQGEQTFEIPQPAFARYLKFKFLSHHGDEFYCTVSQVKVHGSTMLENFQHEWQQSSAEVREVQDFMMKKDPKPTAGVNGGGAAANAANGGPPSQTGGSVSGANDAKVTPATPGSAPQGQAVSPETDIATQPSNEGSVEHRPHAASAATVPPGGKRSSGGGGAGTGVGAGAGTVAVEEIVRGVPAEMVVPASTTCVGPSGTDGLCREEVLAGDRGGNAAAGAGDSTSLGAEIPTMGGGAPGKPNGLRAGDGFGEGATSGGLADQNGGGDTIGRGSADDQGRPTGEAAGAGKGSGGAAESISGQREHAGGSSKSVGDGRPLGEGGVGGSIRTAEAGIEALPGSEEGTAAEIGGVAGSKVHEEAQMGEEEPPPRRGIIHSTMEAISKAVHRGEGSKPKDKTGKAEVPPGSGHADGDAAGAGGLIQTEAGVGGNDTPLPPPSGCTSTAADGAVDGGAGEEVDAQADGSVKTHGTAGASAAANVAGSEHPRPPVTGHSDAGTPGGPEVAATVPGDPASGAVRDTGSSINEAEQDSREQSGVDDRSGGHGGVSGGIPAGSTGHGESRPGSSASSGLQTGSDPILSSSDPDCTGPAACTADGGGSASTADLKRADAERTQGTETLPVGSALPEPSGGHQHAESTSTVEGVATAELVERTDDDSLSQGGLPATLAQDEAYVVSASQSVQTATVEPVVQVEEANIAALAAACLERLSFNEFREEVLARTQQAQQSAGGGVAISGQYESIFKTLMNKIKTLEINQSLFSLYIDDVHGCYQDVIGQMLQEQERARASRSEMLSAQTAHLLRIGDQWPAFQELQAKVAEVENRMLLSSMAWFTSLFCLMILVFSCCFKVFRRCLLGGGQRRRGQGAKGGRISHDE